MSDNVAITAGSGTSIAADEVVDGTLGTVKVQYVKLMDGTLDGTTKGVIAADGMKVGGTTTAADAVALTNNVKVLATTGLYNGSTVDLARGVSNGLNTTGTGVMAAGLVGQLDDTSPGTVTENQFAPVRITARREIMTSPNSSASGVTGVSGTFGATGQSSTFNPIAGRPFDLSLWGTFVGTVQLERRLDATNWLPCTAMGSSVTFQAPCTEVASEPKAAVDYRLNCIAYTSGTINYRLEQ